LSKEGFRDLRPNVVYSNGGLSGLISVDKTDTAYMLHRDFTDFKSVRLLRNHVTGRAPSSKEDIDICT
jgi:hypothetical protein